MAAKKDRVLWADDEIAVRNKRLILFFSMRICLA